MIIFFIIAGLFCIFVFFYGIPKLAEMEVCGYKRKFWLDHIALWVINALGFHYYVEYRSIGFRIYDEDGNYDGYHKHTKPEQEACKLTDRLFYDLKKRGKL